MVRAARQMAGRRTKRNAHRALKGRNRNTALKGVTKSEYGQMAFDARVVRGQRYPLREIGSPA
jgi:hypothetical protein